MKDSIIVFDGTSYFVESINYDLQDGEVIEYTGTFDECSYRCNFLNDNVYDKTCNTWEFGFKNNLI